MIGWTKVCSLYDVFLYSNDGLFLIRQRSKKLSLYVRRKACFNKKMGANYFHTVVSINGRNIRYDMSFFWCTGHNWQLSDAYFSEQVSLKKNLNINNKLYLSPSEQLELGIEIPYQRKEKFFDKLIGYFFSGIINFLNIKEISKDSLLSMLPEERIRNINIELKAIQHSLTIEKEVDRFGILLELREEAERQAK